MAITLDELKDLIESLELRCQAVEKLNAVMVGFKLEEESTYRDPQGDACLAIVFRLAEQGEFLSAFVPACWILGETPHRTVVMEVLLAIQTHFKFVRFDLAEHMIVANCELPIEDGTVTASQVQRIIGALMQVVEKFDVHVRKAIDTGDATAADIEAIDAVDDDSEECEQVDDVNAEDAPAPSSNGLDRLLELMDEAGGVDGGAIEALERLLGGDGAPPLES